MVSWTSPHTFAPNDVVTADQLNDIGNDLEFLHSKDHVCVYRGSNQSISDSTWTVLAFNQEVFDSNTMHDNSTNNSRLKCNSDGLYLAIFKVNFDANTTGVRRVMLRETAAGSSSGGTARGTWYAEGITSNETSVSGSRLCRLTSSDYLEIFAYQDSGGALDCTSGQATTFFQLMQLAG